MTSRPPAVNRGENLYPPSSVRRTGCLDELMDDAPPVKDAQGGPRLGVHAGQLRDGRAHLQRRDHRPRAWGGAVPVALAEGSATRDSGAGPDRRVALRPVVAGGPR